MNREQIQSLIKELIEKVGISTKAINDLEGSGENMWFTVEVNEPHYFTMKEGEALSALNHLVRKVVEAKHQDGGEESAPGLANSIMIDIGGFQKKKIDAVKAIAHMMGERARYFKSNIEIDPMSSFERRIIHEFFGDATDLKTESIGVGPTRRVVIKYIGEI
jgi:spoIIIJ-associated protein